ncbi:hypothetical protein ES332_D07G125200v1 [Gossypium tomentosum]|uniref:Uncharacterized protein n=1 Tax=Gossypium tomentosum TaxID=34277 RepID=A0A5D2K6I6_GOSTO|nr:hypothetical protein ES332_D07G125200v1 [Gossypium tomentosum]
MNSHSILCLFPRYSNYSPIPPFGSPFTDSGVLLLHPYSSVAVIACLLLPKNFPSISYPQIKPNRFAFIFFQPKRLRNSSGKGGNLFLHSSSFILSDVTLPLIAELHLLLRFCSSFYQE